MSHRRTRSLALGLLFFLFSSGNAFAQQEPNFTKEEMKQFLLKAAIINSRHPSKGITSPWRLTLSDGQVTHDAAFQALDAHGSSPQMPAGTVGRDFVDSYKYNIAAYILAEMLGMDDAIPVTVERKWKDKTGSLSWWIPVKMDESDRVKQHIDPPDQDAWGRQLYRIRVFNQLIFDTDFNRSNMLIGEDWRIWRIDFSRAFRLYKQLQDPKELLRCDRHLLEQLRKLDAKELEQKTKAYLDRWERQGVMARRDKLVEHFEKLIADQGEDKVLY